MKLKIFVLGTSLFLLITIIPNGSVMFAHSSPILNDTAPEISNVTMITSDPLDTEPGFGWENISCIVTSDIGVKTVKVVITYFDTVTYPMTHIPGNNVYYYNTTLIEGYYKYYIWAEDLKDNNATSIFQIFTLPMNEDVNMDGCVTEDDLIIPPPPHEGPPGWMREDVNNNGCLDFGDILQITLRMSECLPIPPWMIPPDITNITLTTSNPLDTNVPCGWENVSCTVIDTCVGVKDVKLRVINDTTTEYTMINIPETNAYYYNTTFTQPGNYSYYIWADDLSGNNATSSSKDFALPTNEDVDNNGHVHFSDLMDVIRMYGDTGPDGWVREDVDNNGKVHFSDLMEIIREYGEEW